VDQSFGDDEKISRVHMSSGCNGNANPFPNVGWCPFNPFIEESVVTLQQTFRTISRHKIGDHSLSFEVGKFGESERYFCAL